MDVGSGGQQTDYAIPRGLSDLRFSHFVALLAFTMSAYQFSVGYLGEPIAEIHRPLHIMFALMILFWISPVSGGRLKRGLQFAGNMIWSLLLMLSCGYVIYEHQAIGERMAYVEPLTTWQFIWGWVLVLCVLEAARRSVGWVLVIVGGVFVVYAILGNYLPYPFWHRGYGFERTIEHLYLTTAGIWTTPVAVTASFIFLFVLYGALLLSSGAGDFFTDLARALTGRSVGGPAKTAVVSSAFMGMLSGSSAANVVTTGSFTIPAMKKAGYQPHFAAGVEACASCGGQITPPIMGSAAFIMMEFIGISYVEVMKVSIIPALLYFFSCYMMVDLEARRMGLQPTPDPTAPTVFGVIRRRGYLLLSIVALMYYLFEGYTPGTAAFWAIVYLACLVVIFDEQARRLWVIASVPPVWLGIYLFNGQDPALAMSGALVAGAAVVLVLDGDMRRRFARICFEAMVEAPKLIAPVTVACAVGGLIVGVIVLTGMGERVSSIVLLVGQGDLFLTLFFTMVIAVVLGMGMPTSGAYIVLAALLVPGINKLVVPYYQGTYGMTAAEAAAVGLISTHLFIIFCASKSSLTPPVAIASYAAAAVASSDPWKTSMTAFRIGLPIFIIPYMFVYGPQLLLFLEAWQIALGILTSSLGIFMMSVACIGWLLVPIGPVSRLICLGSALCLMIFGWATDLIGLALLAVVVVPAWLRARRGTPATAPTARAGWN